ncbi:hypothetical protein AcV5_004548 [Taiwanofungus camphoratus]|nr:hypothetical protein AcV5_004548 [Antrodia cinnamomea]
MLDVSGAACAILAGLRVRQVSEGPAGARRRGRAAREISVGRRQRAAPPGSPGAPQFKAAPSVLNQDARSGPAC